MKKLLLSTLGVLAFAASNVQANAVVEIDLNIREDVISNTSHVRSEGQACTYTQGPTFRTEDQVIPGKVFQCPACPVCPKVECVATLKEECSTCMKPARQHHGCKGGSCHKNKKRRHEEIDVVVAE